MIYEYRLNTDKEAMYDITHYVQEAVDKSKVKCGIAIVYSPHTTSGITINENGDPDVKRDVLLGLSLISPDRPSYRHFEGNSDAHLKSSLIGINQTILIEDGKLILGTWQSIYFMEFDGPRKRIFYVKVMQEKEE